MGNLSNNPEVTFDDVQGCEEAKEELKELGIYIYIYINVYMYMITCIYVYMITHFECK